MGEAFLMEKRIPKVIVAQADMNTAQTGSRVSMKGRNRVAFLCIFGTSTSATDLDVTLRQHNAATAGTSKDLSVSNVYYHKINAATVFTKVEPTAAAAAYDLFAAVGDNAAMYVFEVLAEDLDTANGFAWVSVDLGDTGATKLGTVLALTGGEELIPSYGQAI
jgi:hypothetical protein